jgi:hypothetical protein
MPPPTADQLQLIRDFEPVLFFHGGDATVPEERFFPSDAKRYLERCALWKATTPFLTPGDWGTNPVVERDKLGALPDEGAVFLGKGLPSGPFDFLETSNEQECFLDLAGWKPPGSPFPGANRYANLDRIAELYRTDSKLKASEFWYHAEFFDDMRLNRLFDEADAAGDIEIQFSELLTGQFLTRPALICYYLFYPGHDEGIDCPFVDQALEFGSFAGDWTAVVILLDRPSSAEDYTPKLIGLSNRNTGLIKFNGREVRTGMRVMPWSAAEVFEKTHPRLAVARGSHALYVTTEQPSVVGPLTSEDPGIQSCGQAEAPAGEVPPLPEEDTVIDDIFGVVKGIFIMVAKIAAGAVAGGVLGPLGAVVGGAAGLVAGALENASGLDVVGTLPAVGPTTDTVNTTTGKVVHPQGLRPPDVDASRAVEWQREDDLVVDGRHYSTIVDRETQILWPGDPEFKGYTGRWGPRMESDPQTRRAGMRFPNFWLIFFEQLVRNDRPSNAKFLTVGSGTWAVPADWNNSNNTIECIGGGGGGRASLGVVPGGGGGGGAYSLIRNLSLTPGATIPYRTGAGGDQGDPGEDTFFGAASFAAAKIGAKGGRGAAALGSGMGGSAADCIGSVTFSGGSGGAGGNRGGGGGGGAGGPKGNGAAGANGSTSLGGAGGGGGGGGNGGGTGGEAVPPGQAKGGNGGNNQSGMGSGAGGSAAGGGSPGTSGGGGGGGGGGNPSGGAGGDGGPGVDIDATHGSGGGGGGGGAQSGKGGAGGLFGGGGAGSGPGGVGGTPGPAGSGAPGLIIIRYSP